MTPSNKPTERFSNRVTDYIAARPSYPSAMIDFMLKEFKLHQHSVIADIGSGTGILTSLLLEKNINVLGIEPNDEMRKAAENLLSGFSNFLSIKGAAEKTGLIDESVDLISAAQAFHWFDIPETKKEFRRILKPNGFVCLIWNERVTAATEFDQAYENIILEFATDYEKVNHTNINEIILCDFFIQQMKMKSFPYSQQLDEVGLQMRLSSASYLPDTGHKKFEPMCAEIKNMFGTFAQEGKVTINYLSKIYFGKMN